MQESYTKSTYEIAKWGSILRKIKMIEKALIQAVVLGVGITGVVSTSAQCALEGRWAASLSGSPGGFPSSACVYSESKSGLLARGFCAPFDLNDDPSKPSETLTGKFTSKVVQQKNGIVFPVLPLTAGLVESNVNLPTGNQQRSYSAWINVPSAYAGLSPATIIGHGTVNPNSPYHISDFSINADGSLIINFQGGYVVTRGLDVFDDQWHFVVITYSAINGVHFYVDGSLVDSVPGSNGFCKSCVDTINLPGTPIAFASEYGTLKGSTVPTLFSRPGFPFSMANAAAWNVELTSANVADLFTHRMLPNSPAPVAVAFPAADVPARFPYCVASGQITFGGSITATVNSVSSMRDSVAFGSYYAGPKIVGSFDSFFRQEDGKPTDYVKDGAEQPIAEDIHRQESKQQSKSATLIKETCSPSDPVYPMAARRNQEVGTVVVSVAVDENGYPSNVAISRSSGHPRLDKSVMDWMSGCKFSPATDHGRAVAGSITQAYTFNLSD